MFKKIFLLLVLIFIGYISFKYIFFQNGYAEGDTTVKIVSFNEFYLYSAQPNTEYSSARPNSHHYKAMEHNLDLMGLYEPDILLLQEHRDFAGSPSDLDIRETLGLKHYVFFNYGDASLVHGMAIYSRFPIEDTQQIKLRPQWDDRSLGLAKININDRILNVGVVHFPNKDMRDENLNVKISTMFLLKEIFGKNIRTKQAKHLVEVTQDLHNSPLVIGGDFNAVPFSRAWRLMHGAFVDAFPITKMFNGTRSVKPGSDFEVKIDHFFHTKSVESIESSVGYKQGSDHRPIIMEIRF